MVNNAMKIIMNKKIIILHKKKCIKFMLESWLHIINVKLGILF